MRGDTGEKKMRFINGADLHKYGRMNKRLLLSRFFWKDFAKISLGPVCGMVQDIWWCFVNLAWPEDRRAEILNDWPKSKR